MNKHIETFFNVLGISFGLSQIETVLGIIILSINLLIILINNVPKVINYIKQKKYGDAIDQLNATKTQIESLYHKPPDTKVKEENTNGN